MRTTVFTSFVASLSLALAANSTIFERGSSHLAIPDPISTYAIASEVLCALSCSRDVLCEFYHFNVSKHMCSLYHAPGWPANAVTADSGGFASFKAPLWKMALKVSTGTGDVVYDVWSVAGTSDGGVGCSKDPAVPCATIYKDAVVDAWEDISQVRIELYTNNTLAAYAWFDARGADKWSWLSVDRLLASSWDDIKDYASSNTPLASVEGKMHAWSGQYRFIMNADLENIREDRGGWFHILDPDTPPSYDDCNGPLSTIAKPLLRYSKNHGKAFLIIYGNGVHIEKGSYPSRYSLPWAEAASACAAIGETLASEQDLLDLQVGVERGCCNCGWTAEGTAKIIVRSPIPGPGCSNNACGFSTRWDAWCKANMDAVGYADTMALFVR